MPSVAAVSLVRDFFKINHQFSHWLVPMMFIDSSTSTSTSFSASTSGLTSTTSYIQSFYQKVRELAAEAGLTPLHLAAYSGLKKTHHFFHIISVNHIAPIFYLPKSSKSSFQQCSIIRFNHVSQMLLDVSHCCLIHAIIFDCGWISMANLSAYDYSYLPHSPFCNMFL